MKYFIGENDRIKLLVLLCGEEDEILIKAALGTLAVLSSLQTDLEYVKDLELEAEERKRLNDLIEENRIICGKILNVCIFGEIKYFLRVIFLILGQIIYRNLQTFMCL